ncbi:MAG: pyruvate dehydrogenase (acetyl-transferring) E1 component subunit alpha [Chloroflexi bacterium]|nr:pyruvate dehydrogenase (acetyl-transferring) E1 component subunit alpha [Chloroflexota bacterium]
MLIRRFEERAAEMYSKGRVAGFLHLYIGQEAVAAGVIASLRPEDRIVTHYRDHGHALARGIHANRAMAELFGKSTGMSKGKGGSMHFFDAQAGFMGGHAIVGAQMPLAVGLALAASYRGENNVTVCFLGDGAVNEGEFHESINLAALWKLPVLFVLENNGFGMGTRVERACAQPEIYLLAERHNMKAKRTGGMDVIEVFEAAREAIDFVRAGNGPFFLELMTYRFRGHSTADPVEYRQNTDVDPWLAKDPINALTAEMLSREQMAQGDVDRLWQEVELEVDEATQFAEESPFPEASELTTDIYA